MNSHRLTLNAENLSLQGLKLLCVEDDQDSRRLLSMFLRRLKAHVIEAENGELGLAMFEKHQPDIIVSDINMPVMDGIQMTQAIREIDQRDTPVIFLSAYSEVDFFQQAITLGAAQYIVKPVNFEKLKKALCIAIEKIDNQRELASTLHHLQDSIHEYQYQHQRIERFVTELVGDVQQAEAHVISRPKNNISGDFYCMLATENCFYAMLGDGMGHGLSAILPALDLPRQFRELAQHEYSLSRIADELNQWLCQRGMRQHFVAMSLLCVRAHQQLIEVINCGNPAVLLYAMDGRKLHEFASNHAPMGIVVGDDFCPELQSYRCEELARAYLFSDGLPEILDSGMPQVNMQQCLDLMGQHHQTELLSRIEGLLNQVPEERQHDDVTLLEVMYAPLVSGLPESAAIAQSGQALEPALSDVDLKWLSVLWVAADDEGLADCHRLLQRRVGAIDSAIGIAQALDCLHRGKPQLIIADADLLLQDNARLMQTIRALDLQLPVLALLDETAGHWSAWQVSCLINFSFGQCLLKPLDEAQLVAAMRQVIMQKQNLSRLKLLSEVFVASPVAITLTDREGNIISVNPAFTQITGYSEADVLGCNPRILSSGKHDGEFYRNMWAELKTHGRWSGELWNRHKNGELFLEWINICVIRDENGQVSHYASIFADITQRLVLEEKMRHLAHHDHLTNLPNRLLLNDRLNQGILQAQRERTILAVVYLDIDHFKTINDTLGHSVGDELILNVAQALQSAIRKADTVSRLGGDEFAILLPDVGSAEMAVRLVGKIFAAASKSYLIAGRDMRVTLSMGVSLYPRDGQDPAALLKHADNAMYLAKKQGRNGFQFYDAALENQSERYMLIQHGLYNALNRGEFVIHYQPKYALDEKLIVGAEVLLRWTSPELGPVRPDEFIPIAEQTGFIVELGCWLIDDVFKTLQRWQQAGVPSLPLAINISPMQFHRGNLHDTLAKAIQQYGVTPDWVQIELTEGVVMNKQQHTIALLDAIKQLGIRISIDDFGTGYSSLSYLRHLPIDEIKIDRSFLMDMTDQDSLKDSRITAVPLAIIDLAKNLNINLVAEGVETQVQCEFLLAHGCHIIQGYWFSRPVAEADMLALLQTVPVRH